MAAEVHNRYRVLQKLGEGGMGVAYLVEDSLRDNQLMTLKKVHLGLLSERDLAQFGHEFSVLSRLRHPNVVRVYDFDAQELCFTMEYVAGEDLAALALRRFSEAPAGYDWLYDVIAQLCRALQYIHSRGLIHYDLKPSNIRITPRRPGPADGFWPHRRAARRGPGPAARHAGVCRP
jgi:serine/threonine protein kinase